jgi:hypothetical protein
VMNQAGQLEYWISLQSQKYTSGKGAFLIGASLAGSPLEGAPVSRAPVADAPLALLTVETYPLIVLHPGSPKPVQLAEEYQISDAFFCRCE